MNCPTCHVPMIRGVKLECKTGDAQKFICPRCRAHYWQQLTTRESNFHPLREVNQRAAACV